jgi:hypothetical protein
MASKKDAESRYQEASTFNGAIHIQKAFITPALQYSITPPLVAIQPRNPADAGNSHIHQSIKIDQSIVCGLPALMISYRFDLLWPNTFEKPLLLISSKLSNSGS